MRSEGGEFGLDFGAFRGFSPTSSFQLRLLGKRRPLTIRDAMKPSLQLGVGDGVSSGNARRLIKWRFFLFFFFTVSKARVVMSCFKKKKRKTLKQAMPLFTTKTTKMKMKKKKRLRSVSRARHDLASLWSSVGGQYTVAEETKRKRGIY